MPKINNKNTRITSMISFNVDFEQVNVYWESTR